MSEFEINLFGWLIVGLIVFYVAIRVLFEWYESKYDYQKAIDRRLKGISENYDVVWRNPPRSSQSIFRNNTVTQPISFGIRL